MKVIQFIKDNKWLLLILTLAAFLRFYKLDFQSVWLDEIHTLNEASPKNSITDIYDILLITEPHPPLYFYLIHFFFKIFGYTTLVLRCFSAIIGVAGILSMYFLGKELVNKYFGLIAALLVTINPFHIYYSQDGRMYSLLFFTTIVSFYYLLKFIKHRNLKFALLHGVFAALMIYSHFFALFALFAQYVILLFLLLNRNTSERITFLKYCFISGFMTLFLYIPALPLLYESTKRTSIWIQMPENDIYIDIFKEFFANYTVGYLIATVLILIYISFYFYKKMKKSNDKEASLHLIIISTWILIVLIIPLVLSHINLPMIVSRYYINILPAVLLLVAFGLFSFKNLKIRLIIMLLFTFFSLNDLFAIRDYYERINKTQFREVTQFIVDNNTNKELVVTSLGWYLPYFLNKDKFNIEDKDLNTYILEVSKDTLNIKPFWYFDAHIRPYNPNAVSKDFIERHYEIENNLDLYDVYTKHFVPKKRMSFVTSKK